GYGTVTAFAATLPGPPHVINLDPSSVGDVLQDIESVGAALGVPERAAEVIAGLEARIAAVRARAAGVPRRRCVVLEWIAPPYRSGHWTPELVAIAGGTEPLGRMGEDAARVPWEAVVAAAPEVLVLACCGYDLARTAADLPLLATRPGWAELPAVRAGEVYAVDGSAYFSRPGPRLVDSLEMLAEILHPELFAGRFPARAARRLADRRRAAAAGALDRAAPRAARRPRPGARRRLSRSGCAPGCARARDASHGSHSPRGPPRSTLLSCSRRSLHVP